jgi:UDP-GlcNAc3NAcA epimerase
MPEEINRIVADHLSDLLLCPTALALNNLRKEGLHERAIMTGDVMFDACLDFREIAANRSSPLTDSWSKGTFARATVHRAENTDDLDRLREILNALDCIARTVCPVCVAPVSAHRETAERYGLVRRFIDHHPARVLF